MSGAPKDLQLFAANADDVVERDINRLIAEAIKLGLSAGQRGITSSDLRLHATRLGILTGAESERRMNQLNVRRIMRRAGLVPTASWRLSEVPQARKAPNRVWVLAPEFAGRALGGES